LDAGAAELVGGHGVGFSFLVVGFSFFVTWLEFYAVFTDEKRPTNR
jgi:hypothetical protein